MILDKYILLEEGIEKEKSRNCEITEKCNESRKNFDDKNSYEEMKEVNRQLN